MSSADGSAADVIAVCLSGWHERIPADRGASIQRGLVSPLRATIIASFGYKAFGDCDSKRTCKIAERLGALTLAHAEVYRMPTVTELVAQMEALPHWPQIINAYSRGKRVKCKKAVLTSPPSSSNESSTPYECSGLFKGNSIFAPVLGTTYNLYELHGLSKCYGALEAYEHSSASSISHVVHTRVEYDWISPHPPPRLLLEPTAVEEVAWIPAGEDYGGGVNDRHAYMSRRAATFYFRRWDAILSGEIMVSDPQLRGSATNPHKLIRNAYAVQGDYFIRVSLGYHNVSVRRFASGAALRCCEGPCFSHACYRRAHPTRLGVESLVAAAATEDPARVARAAQALVHSAFSSSGQLPKEPPPSPSPPLPLAVLVSGKYRDELERAIQHSIALHLPGSRLQLRSVARPRKEHRSHKPGELAIWVPLRHVAAFRNATYALRVAERIEMGHNGLDGVGRRRRVVVDSPLLQWETA